MATIVLTSVGTLLGGPIGGMIGAIAGQQIDQNILFKPKGREGPRLDTLAVQTSTYGTPIPRLYGTMRVAGTVIWATNLVESKKKSGGKGQPTVTNYSYAANFAVALSSKVIVAVRRIWADGKLLRGSAGDMKVEGTLRVHLGHEDQPPDPLIASAEGGEGTPAYRGLAYAVFEGLALAEFGNRIPMLTFEVETTPTSAAAVIEDVSEGKLATDLVQPLVGYAVGGESKWTAIELITMPLGGWASVMPVGDDGTIEANDCGAHGEEDDPEREATRRRDRPAPDAVELGYFDPARDYQAGRQSAGLGPAVDIALPAVLEAADAKTLAGLALERAEQGAAQLSLSLMPRWLALAPGDEATVAGQPGRWRVAEVIIESGGVRVTLFPAPSNALSPGGTVDPGRNLPSPDLTIGETTLHLLDLGYATRPGPMSLGQRYVAAAGGGPGWPRAPLLLSDGVGGAEPIGAAIDAAVLGVIETPASAASPHLFDSQGAFVVQPVNPDDLLEDATDERLLNGANAAMLGNEIIQFGQAEPMGGGRWRLSRLLRGRRGTEGAIGTQMAGDRFVLLDRESLTPITAPSPGTSFGLIAAGLGDGDGVEAPESLIAEAGLRPLPPVHLFARRDDVGGLQLRWTRQSRTGWSWIDGVDAPLGEERERYWLTLTNGTESVVVECDEPSWTLMPGDPLLTASPNLSWSVAQQGDFGLSNSTTQITSLD